MFGRYNLFSPDIQSVTVNSLSLIELFLYLLNDAKFVYSQQRSRKNEYQSTYDSKNAKILNSQIFQEQNVMMMICFENEVISFHFVIEILDTFFR